MPEFAVFVSVGATANERQEAFVRALEERLRAEGLVPHTVGRNTFSADAPLRAVTELMARCSGAVVIALERTYFEAGFERRHGPREAALNQVRLPTCWNQIEAAMAYSKGLPLLVVVEDGLHCEGLLERSNEWYVQRVALEAAALTTAEFNGVLASWKQKMQAPPRGASSRRSAAELTIGELVSGLKPAQLWSAVAALAGLAVAAFALGAKLVG
jgi:hypothetical protein